MPEHKVLLHARYITTEFDDGAGPGHLLDADAQAGAVRAYRRLLPALEAFSTNRQCPEWRQAAKLLRPALQRVSRNYWRDFDFDDRKRSAQVKAEVQKLIKPLEAAIRALEDRPPFVRHGLNACAPEASRRGDDGQLDLLRSALAANRSLLDACRVFTDRDHRKEGRATRFQNAARDLCEVWEGIYCRKFPRNAKTAPATERDVKAGVKRRFENAAAEFVFVALCEIGSPFGSGSSWVKPSQVEEALGTVLFKGENSSRD